LSAHLIWSLLLDSNRSDEQLRPGHMAVDGQSNEEAEKTDPEEQHGEHRNGPRLAPKHTLYQQHGSANPCRQTAVPGEFTQPG
jgi:hypothetical protein